MANATGPFGLRPIRKIDGTPMNGAVIDCYIASTYATALYVGDPVQLTAASADKIASGKMPSVKFATLTDGGVVFGVIVGFEPLKTDLTKTYNPASTERVAKVMMPANTVFQIRGDGGGTPTLIFPGQNAVMIQGTASTVYGRSGVLLDEGTTTAPSADQSNPLLILSVKNVEDNELGDYAIYEVEINTPFNATGRRLGIAAS